MGLFSSIFGAGSNSSHKQCTETDNPALSWVQDNHGLDAGLYLKAAALIHSHSIAAAREFSQQLEREPTDETVHFFSISSAHMYLVRLNTDCSRRTRT